MHLDFALDASSLGNKTDISTQVGNILAKPRPTKYGKSACAGDFYIGEPIQVVGGDKKLRTGIFKKNPTEKPR